MSIEITDSVNYYKWIPSSSGDLSLGYQLGGNDNLQPIATIGKNGTLTASSLKKTANAADTDAYVFAMVDQNGTLQRGYAVLNSINTNFSSIQNQVNLLSQASTGLTNMINTVTAQASQATSVVNSLASLNLDGRVSTLSSRTDLQQTDIDTLKSQNLNSRVSVAESNLGTLNSTVSTLNGQNLNTRLTSAEGQVSLTKTDVNTLKSQNLNSRISVIENQNLDARLASLTSTLGAISTADANLINQYNQLYAAVQALQLQVTNLSGGSGSGITSNSNLFNMIVVQGVIVIALVLFLVLKK
jgi:chromosome segregation ATPase